MFKYCLPLIPSGDEKVDSAGGVEKFHTKISMANNGVHTWYAPTIFTSICKMDVRFFPFDDQVCELQFGSWAYDSSKIDLEIDFNETGINQNIFQENNEWRIKKVTAKKRLVITKSSNNRSRDICWSTCVQLNQS